MTPYPASEDAKLPQGPGKLILRSEEAQAWRDGFKFLEAAKEHAEKLISDAQAIIQEERIRGYNDGSIQGIQQANQLLLNTSFQVNRYISSYENHISKLAMDIVRNILGEIGETKLMGAVAAKAISSFRKEAAVNVTVHPSQEKNVYDYLAKILEKDESFPSINIHASISLPETGCIVATNISQINASIDVQLAAIVKAFDEDTVPDSGDAA